MAKSRAKNKWVSEFPIQTFADLDFVISHKGWPIGMMGSSPAEFKRRVLAAGISYRLQLTSIDYTLKRYVKPDVYENDDRGLGEVISVFLRKNASTLKVGLEALHTQGELTFGQVGAEVTLFKLPETFDLARMLANRGLFLEVLPILRLCLEMAAWAAVAFFEEDEDKIRQLKAQSCIRKLKSIYEPAGKLYGYFSQFAHWEFNIHAHFLNFDDGRASVISASCKYRAMSLVLCLVILDIILEVVRHIYTSDSEALIVSIQGTKLRTNEREVEKLVSRIVGFAQDDDFVELEAFLSRS